MQRQRSWFSADSPTSQPTNGGANPQSTGSDAPVAEKKSIVSKIPWKIIIYTVCAILVISVAGRLVKGLGDATNKGIKAAAGLTAALSDLLNSPGGIFLLADIALIPLVGLVTLVYNGSTKSIQDAAAKSGIGENELQKDVAKSTRETVEKTKDKLKSPEEIETYAKVVATQDTTSLVQKELVQNNNREEAVKYANSNYKDQISALKEESESKGENFDEIKNVADENNENKPFEE